MGLAGLAELVERPTFALSDTDVAVALDEVAAGSAALEALRLRLVREADARGLAAAAGASSTAAWLRERHRVAPHTASRWVELAIATDGTATGGVLAQGRINPEQAWVIARAAVAVPVGSRADAERVLLEHRGELRATRVGAAG